MRNAENADLDLDPDSLSYSQVALDFVGPQLSPAQQGTPLLQKAPAPLQARQICEVLQNRLAQQGTPLLQKLPDPLHPRQICELLQYSPAQQETLLQKLPEPEHRFSRSATGELFSVGFASPETTSKAANMSWFIILKFE
ncbi:hypothetical protein E4U13_000823 [Claviceps humidiphila]|uniref:Uncharacterized protein n=1 Tax=Claviceps humidiphila TaxID=1294629 RepID=A0A9P7Q346_9HYPO|nr:hypothetical protein E4U13_000823 [Claviceps humidiphila]